MTGKVVTILTGRRIKYLVLLFWLLLVAVAGPLAGKLTGAEKNDAKSWLPGSAESTQVLDAQAAFASPNTIPAVVVYERTVAASPRPTERRSRPTPSEFGTYPRARRQGHRTDPVGGRPGGADHRPARTSARTAGTWRPTSSTPMRATAENGANGM